MLEAEAGRLRPGVRRPGAVPQQRASSRPWDASGPRCWPLTRPIASASGATTSAPITRGSARPARRLGAPPCIALTATATDLVRRDIADQLDLQEPAQFVTGFDRPNLIYHVVAASRMPDKLPRPGRGPPAHARIGDRLCQQPQALRGDRRVPPGAAAQAGRHLSRRPGPRSAHLRAGSLHDRKRRDRRRHQRFRHGRGQGRRSARSSTSTCPAPSKPTTRKPAAPAATACPRSACCSSRPAIGILQELFIENEYPPPEAVFAVYDFLRRLDADPIELTQAGNQGSRPARA